jgi:2-polyprenyl-6-methoxyphenol hydroxylase-like FAD-dependent oxidoreductase
MRILISGAGIAGSTLAYWLARAGHRPTVVERAAGQRSSGNPVDVRGPAVPIVSAMGVAPRLRSAATGVTAMRLIDRHGLPGARLRMPSSEFEVPRADLASILYSAASDDADYIFGDSISEMSPDSGGVDVVFERAAPRRFDLVVGADGLHSTVRRIAFGPESRFVRHLGVYVGTVPLGRPADDPGEALMYNTPGRLISVHPAGGRTLVAFIFLQPEVAGFDHRDTDQHRRLVLDAYGPDTGWQVPSYLDRVRAADDLYFDSVSKVVMPSWSTGRITLLGDAAASVSLFGDGSTMAIAGAKTLADALAGGDVPAALLRYEAEHRRRTDPRRRTARLSAALVVPRTRAGIATRNAAARLLL